MAEGHCEAPCVKSRSQNWDPTSWKSRPKSFQVSVLETASVKIQAPKLRSQVLKTMSWKPSLIYFPGLFAWPGLACPCPARQSDRPDSSRWIFGFFPKPVWEPQRYQPWYPPSQTDDRSQTDWPASVGRNYTEAVCPGRFSSRKSVCPSVRPSGPVPPPD